MKLYKKILGISSLVISLIGLGVLVFILIDGSEYDKISALFLMIPVYIVFHYTVLTKLGFDIDAEKNSRINLIGTIVILVLTLIFPFRYGIEFYKTKAIEKTLSEPKDWGSDDNITTGVIGSLRTKYESNEIFYQLYLSGLKDSYFNLESFTIQLEDEDQFIINKIKIPLKGSTNINSLERNDSLSLTVKGSSYLNSDDYQKISHWALISKKE